MLWVVVASPRVAFCTGDLLSGIWCLFFPWHIWIVTLRAMWKRANMHPPSLLKTSSRTLVPTHPLKQTQHFKANQNTVPQSRPKAFWPRRATRSVCVLASCASFTASTYPERMKARNTRHLVCTTFEPSSVALVAQPEIYVHDNCFQAGSSVPAVYCENSPSRFLIFPL